MFIDKLVHWLIDRFQIYEEEHKFDLIRIPIHVRL